MIEENNTFLAGNVLGPTNAQKIFHNICLEPSMYLMTDFSNPLSPCTHMHAFKVNPFCVRDLIDLTLSSTILTWLVCHRNSRTDVFVSDTHHFLASHSVSSSLPRKAFSLIVASRCHDR